MHLVVLFVYFSLLYSCQSAYVRIPTKEKDIKMLETLQKELEKILNPDDTTLAGNKQNVRATSLTDENLKSTFKHKPAVLRVPSPPKLQRIFAQLIDRLPTNFFVTKDRLSEKHLRNNQKMENYLKELLITKLLHSSSEYPKHNLSYGGKSTNEIEKRQHWSNGLSPGGK